MKGGLSDIILALGIFAVMAIIIVPLPAFLLDLFICFNIAISIILLGTSLFLNRPIDLAILPTAILTATLFRLSLNIASTRMILSYGYAGEVIETFGKVIAGGNVAVGVILFIVITIVQFMVITKGAERIAEVSARFALDAMPGKQMAIDGELNSGLITPEVAQVRRKELERESSLFGSMDGASKFVKGDAIAGIIMTIVNMIGGLGIGVLQKGLDPGYAASKYMILSIGDALGAQIPALITAVATGLIVTRSTSSGESLSSDVITQFMQNPMALIVAGALTCMMGFLPGMPWFLFIPIGVAISFIGINAMRVGQVQESSSMETQIQEQSKPPTTPEQMYSLLGVDALSVHVGSNLIELADPSSGGRLIEDIGALRQHMTLTFGYILPPVRICDARTIGPYEYRIIVRGNTVASSEVYPQRYLILKSHWDKLFNAPPPNALNAWEPNLKEPAYWVQPDYLEGLVKERKWNRPYLTPVQAITYHLSETVIMHIEELFTKVDVRKIIDQVRQVDPPLVDNVIPGILQITDVRKILINLLKEKVSIRDIHYILERLEDFGMSIRDADLLSEKIRMCLARQICSQHAVDKTILAITLSPEIEQLMEESLQRIEDKFVLTLDPEQARKIIGKIIDTCNEVYVQLERRPVIVCNPGIRLPLARFIQNFDTQIVTMSYVELSTDFKVEILNTIEVNDLDSASVMTLPGSMQEV
ncbi:MAG: flagellar biosynthesis protein FlhA [Candidatus Caenarcaniphilales bacterium]|nr:flagellar biosynthesis protein FlhA [Candidatus Caenarcaniphilales bacterium]